MRRHDNIGYDAFNTYRSGDESSRRYDYGNPAGNPRGGRSVFARSSRDTDASDHNYSSEPGYYGSGTSNRSQMPQQPYNQNRNNPENNRYSQYRPQNPREHYPNRDAYNSPSHSYRNDNRNWQDRAENWADHAQDRIERWGDKINNAWENWHGDDNNRVRQNWVRHPEHYPTYSHGNANSDRYSENYDNSPYGNRYDNRNEDYRRNRREDEGFFENIGDRISSAWDRWVGDDRNEERRYQQRSRYSNPENRPGSHGPSSRRDDYDW